MLKFYHISRDCSSENQLNYLEKGVQPAVGRGYGGQSAGFYCWTSNENAERYYRSLLAEDDAQWAQEAFGTDIRLKDGKALKIQIDVNEKDVKNPTWQLDNEQHARIKVGRKRSIFLDFWSANKDCFNNKEVDFTITQESGEKFRVTHLDWDKYKDCPIIKYISSDGKLIEESVTTTKAEDTSRTQALNDYLCKNHKTYSDNYDSLILAAADNKHSVTINGKELFTERLAVKYCGKEPIKDIHLTLLEGEITVAPDKNINNPKDGDIAHGVSGYRLFYEEKPVNFKMLSHIKDLKTKLQKTKSTIKPNIEQFRGFGSSHVPYNKPQQNLNINTSTLKYVKELRNEGK